MFHFSTYFHVVLQLGKSVNPNQNNFLNSLARKFLTTTLQLTIIRKNSLQEPFLDLASSMIVVHLRPRYNFRAKQSLKHQLEILYFLQKHSLSLSQTIEQ